MAPFPFNMFSPFSQAIDRFLYDPVTNWQGAFSPSIVFNANPGDAPIEAHVLSKTGSYGKQLGVLIRAVDVLLSRVDEAVLDEEQRAAVAAFNSLRDEAAEAANDFRSRVSADQIVSLVSSFRESHSAAETAALRETLGKALDPPPSH